MKKVYIKRSEITPGKVIEFDCNPSKIEFVITEDVEEPKSLSQKFKEAVNKDKGYPEWLASWRNTLSNVAHDHYKELFDEALEKSRNAHGMIDMILPGEVRKAMFGEE